MIILKLNNVIYGILYRSDVASYDYDEICQIYNDVRESDFEIVKVMVYKAGIPEESNISF